MPYFAVYVTNSDLTNKMASLNDKWMRLLGVPLLALLGQWMMYGYTAQSVGGVDLSGRPDFPGQNAPDYATG